MNAKAAKLFPLMFVTFLLAAQLSAQVSGSTVSGTVTDATGKAIPKARVMLRNLSTRQTSEAETGPNRSLRDPQSCARRI
jgi:cobalamin biosynthesis protein CobD/CbiB